MSKNSSFSIFSDVDEQVARPVLGSDAAARWQNFKHGSGKKAIGSLPGVAPALPIKRNERLAGTKSIKDEREIEAKIRMEAGDREIGAGYTVFKEKHDHEKLAAEKRKKLILDRVRPEGVPYYLEAEVFEGHKEDYIFTTRDRGTGYYWDGMDSRKRELGVVTDQPNNDNLKHSLGSTEEDKKEIKSAKARERRKKVELTPPPDADPFNPMEQVANAILRREQARVAPPSVLLSAAVASARDALSLGASSNVLNAASSNAQTTKLEPNLVADGWESAVDPSSGKTYYFKRSTNERTWNKPNISVPSDSDQLPGGWKSAKDSSGKIYYYDTSGNTTWKKPS